MGEAIMDTVELPVIEINDTTCDVLEMPCCPACGQPVEIGSSMACVFFHSGYAVTLGHKDCVVTQDSNHE